MSRSESAVPSLLFASVVYAYWDYVKYMLLAIVIFFVVKLIVWLLRAFRSLRQNLSLRDVDSMDGIAFEHYVAQLLVGCGYTNVFLTEHYDYGVDIVAEKGGVRWGVQAKRYSGIVKAEAVRQVVTGLRLYDCDRAMVITNSRFSTVARRLADSNDCLLVDRDSLSVLAR